MKSTSAVGGVVEVALRRVLCILVLVVVVVVVSEPTTTPVQGKPEDKSNRVEATRESTLQTVQNAVDKTGEVGEKIQYHTGQAAEAAKDTATAAGVKVSEATEAAKDSLLTAGGTLNSVGEKAGNAVGSAKESVLGNLAVENRDQNEGVYGTASKYYDTATDKSAQAAEAMKAAAAQAGEKVQSNAYQTADTSQNTIRDAGSTIYDSLSGAGEKISQAADATKVSTLRGTENVHNSAAETLGSAQEKWYDSVAATDFYHPGMMEKLGNIAEVMGWHRVSAEQEWDLSKLSPYNIIIGNAMYEWHQTPWQDLNSHRAGDSVAIDSAHNVGKNVGAARDYATQVASGASENVRDVTAHAKNKLWDSQQESQTGDSTYWDIAKNSAAAAAAGSSVGEKLGSAGEYANDKANVASDSIKSTATRTKDNLQDSAAAAAAGSVGEKLGSAGEYANDKVNAASDSIKSTATRTKENLQDSQIIDSRSKDGYFQDTTDSVNNAASKMGEKLESAGSQAAETAGGVIESMKESSWDKQPNLTDRVVSGFAHNGKERVNEALGATAAGLGAAGLGVQSKTGKELNHIRSESSISSSNLTRFLYLITFATTYGSAIWMTFVSGVILSKSIPRQQFGFVQSRIFPLYLKFVAMGDMILLVLYSIMHPLRSTDSSGVWQLVNLLLLIVGTVFNVFILEPKTTKLFVERMKLEKEEGRGLDYNTRTSPLLQGGEKKLEASKQQFKILHGYSTILNLASLAGLTLHAWHLAHHLAM
ncbi:unnamed protein product [Sphagnum troendelagicum]|uniref:TMEM205-like domain-containing protein n=1 Tax=Sphagnum troendelagicum TaxID=128251 RepID=A0ABP0UN51_9BRYO